MSQTDAMPHDDSTDSTDSDTLTEHVTAMRERLDALDAGEIADMSDLDLVELRTEVKELEDSVESVRKDAVESELKDRVEPGEKLYGLHRVESHSKYVESDEGTVLGRLIASNHDHTEFVSVNASKLASDAPELAEIGRSEYTYFR